VVETAREEGAYGERRGRVKKIAVTPHERRRGWLKNNNPPGDLAKIKRCGAKTRRGTRCQCPAMPNGRCRLHGGLSTGAKTKEGIERIRWAVTKHGRYSKRAKAELGKIFRQLERINPSAARSLEEGLEEPLTVHRLGVGTLLRQSLASSNPIESCFSFVEKVARNVKRWRAGNQRCAGRLRDYSKRKRNSGG
jgi:hypothetical protein